MIIALSFGLIAIALILHFPWPTIAIRCRQITIMKRTVSADRVARTACIAVQAGCYRYGTPIRKVGVNGEGRGRCLHAASRMQAATIAIDPDVSMHPDRCWRTFAAVHLSIFLDLLLGSNTHGFIILLRMLDIMPLPPRVAAYEYEMIRIREPPDPSCEKPSIALRRSILGRYYRRCYLALIDLTTWPSKNIPRVTTLRGRGAHYSYLNQPACLCQPRTIIGDGQFHQHKAVAPTAKTLEQTEPRKAVESEFQWACAMQFWISMDNNIQIRPNKIESDPVQHIFIFDNLALIRDMDHPSRGSLRKDEFLDI